ncbi:hypothetical protein GW17_00051307 [Ensete ventricosum]|nr:hypothetical protein GW17_00051307 [Ensete ventricosum]
MLLPLLLQRQVNGTSGRVTDLAQVRPNPQWSYGRPDTGKADTLTRGRMPHRKDGGHGEGVRQHGKPQGQPGCQDPVVGGNDRPEPVEGRAPDDGVVRRWELDHHKRHHQSLRLWFSPERDRDRGCPQGRDGIPGESCQGSS